MTTAVNTARVRDEGDTGSARKATRPRTVMLALTGTESRRLLRHPVVLSAAALVLVIWLLPIVTGSADRFPVLHEAAAGLPAPFLLIALATLVAANLAVLRSHRHGTDVCYDVLPLSSWRRTLAHLLSLLPTAAAAALLAGAWIGQLALLPGAVGRPDPWDLAAVPALVLLLGAVGVLFGRLVRSAIVAPLAVAVLTFSWLFGLVQRVLPYRHRWLSPIVLGEMDFGGPQPTELLGRPTGAHLLYLAALIVLVAVTALLRAGAPRAVSAATAAAAAALTVVAGAAQVRPPSPELVALRTAATNEPAAMQRCEQRRSVTYCAFPVFLPRVGEWDRVVDGVRRRMPATAADQPFAVRQRLLAGTGVVVGWDGFSGTPSAVNDSWRADDQRAGTPGSVPVGTSWGSPSDEIRFSARVAHRLVTGGEVAGDSQLLCGGPGVLTLWLAGQATPRAATGLSDVANSPLPSRTADFSPAAVGPGLSVGQREVTVASTLLGRPTDQVAAVVTRSWAELTAPATTVERAAAILGVEAPASLTGVPAGEESTIGDCG